MPTIGYSDIDSLPDALATDRFEILIEPNGQAAGTNRDLAIRCQQIVVPEELLEPMLLQIHGMEFSYRGRRTYDKAIAASFVEFADGIVSQRLRTWMQQVVGSESHNGAPKEAYSTVGTLNIYDQSGNVALAYQFDNLWPNQVPQTPLDGTNAAPYIVQVTFTYDRLRQAGVPVL